MGFPFTYAHTELLGLLLLILLCLVTDPTMLFGNILQMNVYVCLRMLCVKGFLPHCKKMIAFAYFCLRLYVCWRRNGPTKFLEKVATTCTQGWVELKCFGFVYLPFLGVFTTCGLFCACGIDFLQMCCTLMALSVSVANSAWLVPRWRFS